MTGADDEGRHRSGTDPQWAEAWAFDFFHRDGSVGGFVRLGLGPAGGVAWYWAYLAGAGRPVVAVRDHDVALPRGRHLEVRAAGMWSMLTCETPHQHWSVGLEAAAVALDDPADAYRGERGDPVPLGFDLEWEEAGPVFGYARGPGYQQPCEVHGDVLVGDERIVLDGWGGRSHTWGRADWWGRAAWWTGGRLADGTAFHGVAVGPPGQPSCLGGYVTGPDRRPVAVSSVTVATTLADEGLPRTADARLGELTLTVTPIAHAPLLLAGPDGRVSRLPNCLCRFDAGGGRSGLGWASWLQPQPGPAT